MDIQSRLASGKRINKPSDDPSGSVQAIRLSQAKSVTEQYVRNSNLAQNRLQLEENTISGVEDALTRARELLIQASNTILTNEDRQSIAIELKQHLKGIVGLANTQDANQEYLFAGSKVTQRPFTQLADGNVVYNGDQAQRAIQISSGQQVNDGDAGASVFMGIDTGNGKFTTQAGPANTGTGVIDSGQVFDSTSYIADVYTLNIVTNASGNTGFNVTGVTSGQIIPPLPQDPTLNAPDFVDEATIRFNGLEFSIQGTPQPGDTFSVAPGFNQSLFQTFSDVINTLETERIGPASRADLQNNLSSSLLNIDRAMEHLSLVRSSIGSRLKLVEDRTISNENFIFEVTSTLSDVQDLDLISAASELQQRLASLEASQAAYLRIQGLSLFNFLT